MPVAGKWKWKLNFQSRSSAGDFVALNSLFTHSLYAFTKKWDMGQHSQFLRCLLSTAQKATCQRNNISFYNWWIYLLCCENSFSAKNFKISFLLQLHEPGDTASLKKLFLNFSNNTIIPGWKVPSESFPPPSFSRTSSPSSSSPASSCPSISVA